MVPFKNKFVDPFEAETAPIDKAESALKEAVAPEFWEGIPVACEMTTYFENK